MDANCLILELIRAANGAERLTMSERARLLQLAEAEIRDQRGGINLVPCNDNGMHDYPGQIHKMVRQIGTFSAAEVSAKLLQAAEVIKAGEVLLQAKRYYG